MKKKECDLDCTLNVEGYCQLSELEGFDGSECDVERQEDLKEIPPEMVDEIEMDICGKGGIMNEFWFAMTIIFSLIFVLSIINLSTLTGDFVLATGIYITIIGSGLATCLSINHALNED